MCIILVRVFDYSVGDCRTRFLDMPIVKIGTAVNLFTALKSSLESKGYNFSKAVALYVRYHQRNEGGKVWCAKTNKK